jgi:hypothetical protein
MICLQSLVKGFISLPGPPIGHYPYYTKPFPRREKRNNFLFFKLRLMCCRTFFLLLTSPLPHTPPHPPHPTTPLLGHRCSRMLFACIPEYVTGNTLRVSRLDPSFVYPRPLMPLLQSFGHRCNSRIYAFSSNQYE